MNRKPLRLLSLLLLLLLLLPGLAGLAEAEPDTAEETSENFFSTLELTYLDGEPFDASVFNGKPVFLNIWATWCSPCLTEMPHLDELAKEYGDRINIIGLHSEGLTVTEAGELLADGEKTQAALDVKDRLGLTFPLLNPDVSLFILMNNPDYGLQVSVLPTTWLIDGEGFVRSILTGSRDRETWAEVIDGFLTNLQEEKDGKSES